MENMSIIAWSMAICLIIMHIIIVSNLIMLTIGIHYW